MGLSGLSSWNTLSSSFSSTKELLRLIVSNNILAEGEEEEQGEGDIETGGEKTNGTDEMGEVEIETEEDGGGRGRIRKDGEGWE